MMRRKRAGPAAALPGAGSVPRRRRAVLTGDGGVSAAGGVPRPSHSSELKCVINAILVQVFAPENPRACATPAVPRRF